MEQCTVRQTIKTYRQFSTLHLQKVYRKFIKRTTFFMNSIKIAINMQNFILWQRVMSNFVERFILINQKIVDKLKMLVEICR